MVGLWGKIDGLLPEEEFERTIKEGMGSEMDTHIPIVTAISRSKVRGMSGHWHWVVQTRSDKSNLNANGPYEPPNYHGLIRNFQSSTTHDTQTQYSPKYTKGFTEINHSWSVTFCQQSITAAVSFPSSLPGHACCTS
ncbi:hypothetical protein EDB85DRAFT_1889251 [Lactarius pseudohatsudake]|nr:hypothetical protein EDB85DRAFT_1889251 [Lactarius pseudohatsudake]